MKVVQSPPSLSLLDQHTKDSKIIVVLTELTLHGKKDASHDHHCQRVNTVSNKLLKNIS